MEAGGCIAQWVDEGSTESHRFFLARRTVLEMLFDRGYAIPATDLELTLPGFRANYGENPDLERLKVSTFSLSKPSDRALVIFWGTDPVKKTTIQAIYSQVSKENLMRLILVLQSHVTSKAQEAFKAIIKFKVEIFQITELLVNITKHNLKPRHDILTLEEKEALLKKYNLCDSQLPRMLETDAVARYYGLEKGQVVKVTYDGELTGSHVTYRCIL